ncbi:MAG: hypothetical protein R3F61_16190 [Myxococcota bacterium]
MRDRPILFVLGPDGVGKSLVARRVAPEPPVILDNRDCQKAILTRVRNGHWDPEIVECRSLVLDGPVWLQNRPSVVAILAELLALRSSDGRRTVICQADTDASVHLLMDRIPCGSSATIALRFPDSRKARMRVAERICQQNGIPLRNARRAMSLRSWNYRGVREALGLRSV